MEENVKLKWTDKERNEYVCINKDRRREKASSSVDKKEECIMFGTYLTKKLLENTLTEGKIKCKQGRGKRRIGMLEYNKNGRIYGETKDDAQDREK